MSGDNILRPRPPSLFAWTEKPRMVFLGMLAVAILIHLVAIYLFRPVFPESTPSPLSSPTIYLFDQDSPTASSLSRWLEAEDPSLFTRTRAVITLTFPKIRYIPSYAGGHPVLIPPPTLATPIPIPLESTPGPVGIQPPMIQKNFISPAQVAGTRLELAGEPAGRNFQKLPPQGILVSPSQPSSFCTFLVAVSPKGEFRSIFLLHSSGNSELDQLAMDNLRQSELTPIENQQITWGTITYLWGLTKNYKP